MLIFIGYLIIGFAISVIYFIKWDELMTDNDIADKHEEFVMMTICVSLTIFWPVVLIYVIIKDIYKKYKTR